MISRTYAEVFEISGDSYLSQVRIGDRAFNIHRVDGGCEFNITRHLKAFMDPGNMKRVVETWHADNSTLVLTLVGTRDWIEGDPDRGFSDRKA